MDTIQYQSGTFNVDIINYGSGDVYVNWKGDVVVEDATSLLLKEGVGYEIREGMTTKEVSLNIISSSAAVVQVVKSR